MKRVILLMSALLLCTSAVMADGPGDTENIVIEPIKPKPNPRSLTQPVISCLLHNDGTTGTLTFDIDANIGGASITVTNISTGDIYTEYCPSTPASCMVVISCDAGSYVIEIDTDNGKYYGEFVL